MSKRHQANRRRTYGRRQHELRERPDRSVGAFGWTQESDADTAGGGWAGDRLARSAGRDWAAQVRIG